MPKPAGVWEKPLLEALPRAVAKGPLVSRVLAPCHRHPPLQKQNALLGHPLRLSYALRENHVGTSLGEAWVNQPAPRPGEGLLPALKRRFQKVVHCYFFFFFCLCGLGPGRGPGFLLVPSGDKCFRSRF